MAGLREQFQNGDQVLVERPGCVVFGTYMGFTENCFHLESQCIDLTDAIIFPNLLGTNKAEAILKLLVRFGLGKEEMVLEIGNHDFLIRMAS